MLSIAAASIIAKVTRDRLMCALAQDCPGYGFETHKGYAVPEHREALDRLGPSRPPPPLLRAGRRRAAETLSRDRRAIDRARSSFTGGRRNDRRDRGRDLRPVASAARALYQTSERLGQARSAGIRTFHALHLAVVELIRARPRLVVWIVVLVQAAIWLLLPMLLYRSPPGDLATVLAFGREYQVGTWLGPPLAFWLADIAFRAAGNHMFGVYLLAQLCAVADLLESLSTGRARSSAGSRPCSPCCSSMTVTAFSSPGVEFGPLVLARPLWALLLLHSWQLIGQNRRNAWFAWSIEAGLLLLTTSAAPWLLLLLAGFAVATARGPARADVARSALCAAGDRGAGAALSDLAAPRRRARHAAVARDLRSRRARRCNGAGCSAAWCSRRPAIVLLAILNSGWFARNAEDAPIIYRPPVDPLARDFVYFFALAPALLGSLVAALFGLDHVVGGAALRC